MSDSFRWLVFLWKPEKSCVKTVSAIMQLALGLDTACCFYDRGLVEEAFKFLEYFLFYGCAGFKVIGRFHLFEGALLVFI